MELFARKRYPAQFAGAVASATINAVSDAWSGRTGEIPDTMGIPVCLAEIERRGSAELGALARSTRFILAWRLFTGEEFPGMRFEQCPGSSGAGRGEVRPMRR